jgi:hypothetical protein
MFISGRLIAAASVAAVSFALAAPASAAPLFHERIHDSHTEEIDDFCGLDDVVYTVDVTGIEKAGTRGRDQLVYFLSSIHGFESFTNPLTGESFIHTLNVVIHDQTVTDNGDGTLTIVVHAAGGDKWFGSDGEVRFLDTGTIQFSFIVDHNGTPSDPSDDTEVADLGVVRPSTGRNDTEGRDFCEDFLSITG